MITRKSLADEIDLIEADIKALNDSKRACFDAYRDQIIGAGIAKPNIKAEIEAVKVAIKRRREAVKDENALIEKDELIDEVFHEITRAPRATRENIEKFDAETGEILEDVNPRLAKQVIDGMQTEASRAALMAAVDIMIELEEAEEQNAPERPSVNDEPYPEAGPQVEASPAGTGSGTLADREGRHEGEAVSAGLPTNPEKNTASYGEAGHHSLDRVSPQAPSATTGSVDANTGGDHVDEQQSTAAQAGAVVSAAPAIILRPNCRNPDNCGGYGQNHCGSCQKAMRELEAAE